MAARDGHAIGVGLGTLEEPIPASVSRELVCQCWVQLEADGSRTDFPKGRRFDVHWKVRFAVFGMVLVQQSVSLCVLHAVHATPAVHRLHEDDLVQVVLVKVRGVLTWAPRIVFENVPIAYLTPDEECCTPHFVGYGRSLFGQCLSPVACCVEPRS